ncbi:MAG: carbohydrate kinase [Treponema sp.]|jgi:fructokinase|nr:carbohydrate kinase [Treponema sp.]
MIVCCGEALIDMVPVPVPTQESPERETGFLPCPGGSPYNTALALGRLGVPVQFLGQLSRDFFGERLITRLRQNKVGTDLLVRSEAPSTLAFVHIEAGKEPQYLFYTKGTAGPSLTPADIPESLPEETQGILFGSIAMTMEPIASAIEALIFREDTQARKQGKEPPLISLDPNIRPFMIPHREAYIHRFETWLKAVSILKISTEDLAYIYPDQDLKAAMERTLTLGVRLVLLTQGSAGALALLRKDQGEILQVHFPGFPVTLADTIGAGDTFHGAFLAWLELHRRMSPSQVASLTTEDLSQALGFANKAASLVCTRHGANPPTLAEMEAFKD